ncbi:ABC transporter substrate-binding protein [Nocardiopsis sp. CC223A]|uniref:ABC transporter substrate-binding protein n=1 Tax=Nocardiopsis sp. CC223A TaxID=3044051 RepID=UPI00278C0822|nr:ABC transporter substrate-binding protein [Nocardiopsis sp. CC223A]
MASPSPVRRPRLLIGACVAAALAVMAATAVVGTALTRGPATDYTGVAWAPTDGPALLSSPVVSPEPLTFGYVLPEPIEENDPAVTATGEEAVPVGIERVGVELAIREINATGGVLGHRLPDPVAGREPPVSVPAGPVAAEVVAQGVHVLVGGGTPVGARAMRPDVTGAGVLMCSGADTRADAADDLYFSASHTWEQAARALARAAVADGHRSAAVIVDEGDFGADMAAAVEDELHAAGVETTTERVRMDVEGGTLADPLRGLSDIGPFDTDAVILAEDLPGVHAGENGHLDTPAERLYVTGPAMPGERTSTYAHPGTAAFRDALIAFEPAAERNGADPAAAASAFDCVTATALAAQSAGSVEPADIAAHLPRVTSGDHACGGYAHCLDLLLEGEDIAYVGPRGPLRWDGPGAPSVVPVGLSGPNTTGPGPVVGLSD